MAASPMTSAPGDDVDASAGRVIVLGSANVDLVVDVPRRPDAGETLLGADLRVSAGGKGANQAAAAARAGARTAFIGCIGADAHGELVRSALSAAGVDVGEVLVVDRPTGTALILVTPDGENSIVVSSGANAELGTGVAAAAVAGCASGDVLVLGLESPLPTVMHAVALAAGRGIRVVLNAAPAQRLDLDALSPCDPLIVNEHEARALLDDDGDRAFEELARRILARGVRSVVITLGAAGAVLGDADRIVSVPAFEVQAVDSTGAGDAFVGSVACELARGATLHEAVLFATAVAAISVQRPGAQPSYPDRGEVESWRGPMRSS